MRFLHEMRIVHRDLKSLNVLVRLVKATTLEIEYVVAKVTDFGLSKTKEMSMTYSNQTLNVGTLRWMAPEVIKSSKAESEVEVLDDESTMVTNPFKCDVYSFGMVCYEILTGDIPFSSTSDMCDVKKMVLDGNRPPLPNRCHILLKHLIEKCWSQDANKCPYFSDICAVLRYLKSLLLMPYKFFFLIFFTYYTCYYEVNVDCWIV
jgi:serine/threonine protein kinase